MRAIIRGLFGERTKKYKETIAVDYFSKDLILKILQLMDRYNISYEPLSLSMNNQKITVVNLFLNRLSFLIKTGIINNEYDLNQLYDHLTNSNLNHFFLVIELYAKTLFEISEKDGNMDAYFIFIEEFNNLIAYNKVQFKLVFDENLNRAHIEQINSEREEENKKTIYGLIKNEPKVNEHFTKALDEYAKREFKDSIENAYLTLEKYLKIKTGNHKLDAQRNFPEFQKKYPFKKSGIFSTRPNIVKDKISLIYSIRSELKSHSDKEIFDTNEFLEETARFQLNEVMTCIILLGELSK